MWIRKILIEVMRLNNKKYFSKIIKYSLALIVLSMSIFPIFWILLTSFKSRIDIMSMTPKVIFKPIFSNYLNMLIEKQFSSVFVNTIIISFSSAFLALTLGTFAAYGFARFKVKYNNNLLFWILSTRMFPPITTVLPYFILMAKLNMLGTYWGLILVHTAYNLPFSIWMMKGFFEEIPKEIDEAALIDGCSVYSCLFKIDLPLSTPGLMATAIFCLIFSWNEFLMASILTGPGTHTVPVAISELVASHNTDWGGIAAMGILSIIPIFLFILSVQKYIAKGLTFGAIK